MPLEGFAGEVGGQFVKLVWEDNGMTEGFNNGARNLNRNVMRELDRSAPEIEASMKLNAPWNDQTGNARNGLGARSFDDGSSRGIVLFHSVPYGIYLETKYSGRDAIIGPTIEEWGPKVMERLRGVMGQ